MSFNVVLTSKQPLSGHVSFVSAGIDSVFTCRNVVSMSATVVGDLRGHTVEWEQISGAPVQFLSPTNELEMTFTFNSRDDKQFRFYMDRGTPMEWYDDVWAWQTPTDTHYHASQIPSNSHTISGINNSNWDSTSVHVITEFVDYNTAFKGYASATDTNKALFWVKPPDSQYVTHYVIQRWENGAWTDFAVTNAKVQYAPVENGYNYRLLTYHLNALMYGSKYYVTVSKTIRVSVEPEPFGESGTSTGSSFISRHGLTQTGYDVLQRFLLTQQPPPSLSPNTNSHIPSAAHQDTGYSLLERTVFRYDVDPSIAPNTNSTISAHGHVITGFSVIDLVNIEIGSENTIIQIGS